MRFGEKTGEKIAGVAFFIASLGIAAKVLGGGFSSKTSGGSNNSNINSQIAALQSKLNTLNAQLNGLISAGVSNPIIAAVNLPQEVAIQNQIVAVQLQIAKLQSNQNTVLPNAPGTLPKQQAPSAAPSGLGTPQPLPSAAPTLISTTYVFNGQGFATLQSAINLGQQSTPGGQTFQVVTKNLYSDGSQTSSSANYTSPNTGQIQTQSIGTATNVSSGSETINGQQIIVISIGANGQPIAWLNTSTGVVYQNTPPPGWT
jgi:FlxA-like protein